MEADKTTAEELVHRYPGSNPFSDNELERKLFFGREEEKESLFHLIRAERLVVLFAKSGIGKTSLLQAGIFHRLRKNDYLPVTIRLNEPEKDPVESVIRNFQAAAQARDIEINEGKHTTLQEFFTVTEFWSKADILLKPILVFDQFEEIFTLDYSQEKVQKIIKEISGILKDTHNLSRLRIIITIREDFLALLEEISYEIPEIFQNRFRLMPLRPEQARHAIEKPASLDDDHLVSRRFKYKKEALDDILNFLGKQKHGDKEVITKEIEPFQLQLICQHIEEQVIREREKKEMPLGIREIVIDSSVVGGQTGMQEILHGFYQKQLNRFNEPNRTAVQNLIEKGLISSTGRRLTMQEGEIYRIYGVHRDYLHKLVKARLLRSEPRLGSTYYELSHDTLVGPILKSYKKRQEIEEKEKQRRIASRKNRQLILLGSIAGVFLFMAIFTAQKWKSARDANQKLDTLNMELQQQAAIQERQRVEAVRQRAEAERQRDLAEILKLQTDTLNVKFKEQVIEADKERAEAERQRDRAELEQEKIDRVSTSLWLSSWADIRQNNDPEKALALANEAMRIDSNYISDLVYSKIYYNNTFPEIIARHKHVYDLNRANHHDVFITAGSDGYAEIRDYEGKELKKLKHPTDYVNTAIFSPSDKYIITSAGDTVYLWTFQGNLLQKFSKSDFIMDVAVSRDEKYLAAASNDSTVTIWNINGEQIRLLTGHHNKVWGVDFSPSGDSVATASWDGKVYLWNKNGQILDSLTGHVGAVYSVYFSPDGKYLLTSGQDFTARLWTVEGTEIARFSHSDQVLNAKFTPDPDYILTVSYDKTAAIWDRKGNRIRVFNMYYKSRSATISSNLEYLFTAPENASEIKRWPLSNIFPILRLKSRQWVRDVKITSDSQFIVSAGENDTVKIWNRKGELAHYIPFSNEVTSIDISPDDRTILAGTYGYVQTIDLHSGNPLQTYSVDNNDWILSVAYSPDNKYFAAGTYSGFAYIWQNGSGSLIKKVTIGRQVWGLDISPNSMKIAASSYDSMRVVVFSPAGNILLKTQKFDQKVGTVKFARNSNDIFVGMSNGKLLLLRGDNGSEIQRFIGHNRLIWSIDISKDGSQVLSCSEDNTAKIWNLNGRILRSIKHDGMVLGGVFCPDNSCILTATAATTSENNMVYMWKQKESMENFARKYEMRTLSPDDIRDFATGITDLYKLRRTGYIWDALYIQMRNLSNLSGTDLNQTMSILDSTFVLLEGEKKDSLSRVKLSQAYGTYSWHLLFVNKYRNSLFAATRALQIDPSQTWIYTNYALASLFLGNLNEAIRIYQNYMGLNDPQLYYPTFRAQFIKDWQDLEKAGKQIPHKDVLIRVLYGDIAAGIISDYPDLADLMTNMILSANNYYSYNYYNITDEIIKRDGNNERALQLLEHEDRFYSQNGMDSLRVPILSNMMQLYYNNEDLTSTKNYLLKALKIEPDNIDLLTSLGTIHTQELNYPVAIQNFEKAVGLLKEQDKADYLNLYNNLAYAYFENGQYGNAREVDQETIHLNPDYILSYYTIIQTLIILKNFQSARDYAGRLVDRIKDSEVLEESINQGRWFWNTKDRPVYIETNPQKKYYALFNFALTEWISGNRDSAMVQINHAREIYDDQDGHIRHLLNYNINFIKEKLKNMNESLAEFQKLYIGSDI